MNAENAKLEPTVSESKVVVPDFGSRDAAVAGTSNLSSMISMYFSSSAAWASSAANSATVRFLSLGLGGLALFVSGSRERMRISASFASWTS